MATTRRSTTRSAAVPTRPRRTRRRQPTPSPEAIALRAYELFEARGGAPGHALSDWLAAERELSAPPPVPPS